MSATTASSSPAIAPQRSRRRREGRAERGRGRRDWTRFAKDFFTPRSRTLASINLNPPTPPPVQHPQRPQSYKYKPRLNLAEDALDTSQSALQACKPPPPPPCGILTRFKLPPHTRPSCICGTQKSKCAGRANAPCQIQPGCQECGGGGGSTARRVEVPPRICKSRGQCPCVRRISDGSCDASE